jgi:hypothetical protein
VVIRCWTFFKLQDFATTSNTKGTEMYASNNNLMIFISSIVLYLTVLSSTIAAPTNLVLNGDFSQGDKEWNTLWTRKPETGKASIVTNNHAEYGKAIKIDYIGDQDWSVNQVHQLKVKPGEIYELSGDVKLHGPGLVTLTVITRDENGEVQNWSLGKGTSRKTEIWKNVYSRFIIPDKVTSIQPRIIGSGAATIRVDNINLTSQGNLDELRNRNLPNTISISNDIIRATLDTTDATINFKDNRGNLKWIQNGKTSFVILDAKAANDSINIKLLNVLSLRKATATICLDGNKPEFLITLKANGKMTESLLWPAPFKSTKGEFLIMPVNEGISYPVDDESLPEMYYYLYGGHGLCMPWYGAMANNTAGWMAIIETPDDAAVRVSRQAKLLTLSPEWKPQKGNFGPDRVIKYIFFDRGGYVAMAKRYREYAKNKKLFKTLAEKVKTIPAVDLLVGAVNVWCWDKNAPEICSEMQSLGIKHILWSSKCTPDVLKKLNAMDVLTSRYDIYQDSMNPKNFSKLAGMHPDWTSDAWANDDLIMDSEGERIHGWQVTAKDGSKIPCGVLCDKKAVAYAKKRIPEELKTHPYHSRFIDTTTASPWRECYNPKHPMTRTDSKESRMNLLRYISEECGLVCGSETGHDAAVPYVHYFEGMMSLGPYRIPDSGRKVSQIWEDVPEKVAKFQAGHFYRIPLWELVYHDCVVSYWYWGDYNNKLPKLWDRRDLLNTLYGTPPMFMFTKKSWKENRERFVKSYKTIEPSARQTGYSEMLSHEWLTSDHSVQRTRFANGITITVNFGEILYSLTDGTTLAPVNYDMKQSDK